MSSTRILIVEDEMGIANFLIQGLEEEQLTPTHCVSGEAALEMLQKQLFDVILLDWTLPKLSGLEVCQTVRNTANINQQTPILFTTAKDTIADTIAGLESGANDYLKKPYDFNELLARINVHLRPKTQANCIQMGTITLNTSEHICTLEGETTELTAKEFQLLWFLFQHKNKICSRKEILSAVWDIHFEYDSGVIEVFVNAIRKKLNLSKNDPRLLTVRGVGYLSKDV